MAATFAKLRDGSWGLRIEGETPAQGAWIEVSKKSGAVTRQRVGRVLWRGAGVALCEIGRTDEEREYEEQQQAEEATDPWASW